MRPCTITRIAVVATAALLATSDPAAAGPCAEILAQELANRPDLPAAERAAIEERLRFLDALAQAKPIPMRQHTTKSKAIAADPLRLVRFDLGSREITELVRGPIGGMTRVPGDHGAPLAGMTPDGGDGSAGADPRLAGTCTPPAVSLATHGFPWRTVTKLLMRFNVAGTDFFYVCSAATVNEFHLISAGHCIFNWDPNDDGNEDDAAWADEVWAWPAQTDLVDPFACDPDCPVEEDYPWGVAKAVTLYSYDGWTKDEDFNHDMAYIALDRRIGIRVGWMGAEAGVETNSLNFDGYPAETPYVPACTVGPYPGFDADNVTGYTATRIELCAYVYGGHSGGPEWRLTGSDRYIQGVNSTSDRMGSAEGTRLTVEKFDDLYKTVIPNDEVNQPPTARPELIEFVLDLDAKDILDNSVCQGTSFQVEYNLYNVGFASTGAITVDYYLSTNTCISGTDRLIGSVNLATLGSNSFYNPTTTLTVPCTVPPGTYYVGWIMSCATAEYDTDNNSVVIADETLSVTSAGTPPSIVLDATGGVVDANCEFLLPFEAVVTDACELLAADVGVAVAVVSQDPGGGPNATLGTPTVNVVQSNATTVTVEGTVLVTGITSCPATIEVTVTAEDRCGNQSEESTRVDVVDETPPTISTVLDPDTLWPPNHKLVTISAETSVEDACDPGATFVLTNITSDEPDDGSGDGNTINDIQGADYGTADTEFQLRAERSGSGDGRTYTVTYTATDGCGNSAASVATVTVPHDQSGHALAANGFLPDGSGIALGAPSVFVVIPGGSGDATNPALDVRTIDVARTQIGNHLGRVSPISSWRLDADHDGTPDLAIEYPAEATRVLATRSARDASPVAFRYEDASRTGYLVPDVFALGAPVVLPVERERPEEVATKASEPRRESSTPQRTALVGIQPNPFNPSTTVWFDMAAEGRVTIEVYDVRGLRVRTLVSGERRVGRHSSTWDGRDQEGNPVASGVYLFRFASGERSQIARAVLLK